MSEAALKTETPSGGSEVTQEPAQPTAEVINLTSFNVDMGLAMQMAEFIVNIVKESKNDLNHEALRLTAAEHSADDVANLLALCGAVMPTFDRNEGESDEDYTKRRVELYTPVVANYLPSLDHAKKIAAERIGAKKQAAGETKAAKQPKAPKAPKAAKAPKAPKQPKAPKTVEIAPVETVEVASATHVLPEKKQRALKVAPFPTTFFLENGDKASGNIHQVDPSRPEGYAPVMPNGQLYADTGNYYKDEPDETVQTSKKYAGFVGISHYTYKALVEKKELRLDDEDLVKGIIAKTGEKLDEASKKCVRDTLRDLALFGVCKQFMQGRTRIFRVA